MSGSERSAKSAAAAALVVLIVIIVVDSSGNDGPAGRCLVGYPESAHKASIYFRSQSHELTIQVSRRISSRLSSHIFKIFLEEVMGYRRIKLVPDVTEDASILINKSMLINKSLLTSDQAKQKVPLAMINLEVFVSPDIGVRRTNFHQMVDCGSLAPTSRFGWFVPSALLQRTDETLTSWEFFTHQDNVLPFDIIGDDLAFIRRFSMYNNSLSKYFCNEQYCENGMFIPDHCRSMETENSACALMLAPFIDSTDFIVDHIMELKVYIKVIWLGPYLDDVVNVLTDKFRNSSTVQSVLFLNWSPGYPSIDERGLTSLLLPTCESMGPHSAAGCPYELTKVVKIAWVQLQVIGRPVFEAAHKMHFTKEEYEQLIDYYKKYSDRSDRDIACHWMNSSMHIWSKWKPNYKDELYIGGIFPLTGASFASYNAKGIVVAARMAEDAINANTSILHDYNLTVFVHDGQCRADMVMKTFFDYIVDNYYDKLLGVLGPACSETVEPLAGISKHYKTVIISYSAEGSSFSDRTKYPYFFRTIGENKQYKYVYLELLKKLGWKRVAALTEDGQKYTEYISYTEALLQQNGIQFIANSKFPREYDKATLTRYLSELKKKGARVLVADMYEAAARAVVCEALRLRMTARHGYVWFLPLWLTTRWYNTTYYNAHFNESTDCTPDEMVEAINGHFALSHAPYARGEQVMQEGVSVSAWRGEYARRCAVAAGDSAGDGAAGHIASEYAGYAYDAVWAYALAVDKLLKETPEALSDLHSVQNTQRLVKIIGDTNINGVSGNIRFRGGPSRFSVVNIAQWVNYEFRTVGSFYPNVSEEKPEILGGKLILNESSITWLTPDGKKPDDGFQNLNQCAFQSLADFLNVSCSAAIILANVFGFAIIGIILLSVFFYFKSRYEKQLHEQYMTSGLTDPLTAANLSSLDKWEIPRERIVINRKLGEGAFGMVYGGEAFFKDKGWTAVAVKTLKIGSTMDMKLDFLSEAESMKRFIHKNIIKLLGVCTQNEPVYTIMEFMLYGDLKTYLLARRHLVNEKHSEESEEISSKKLTAMALDIARALSYLADLKYVHRDIACRNCLVNTHRVVKLADFGMTRLIFENDYYKFSRKGFLPVRWMAPESLGLGIFTPASDVWSYGVLLYEIITFGSFPFQGYSNNQVLEYVKSGHTVTIPSGVKPQLAGLMKSCWNLEHKTRPNASEIVDFLANNPRLLAPCLDVPIASVQVEYTAQLEMEILPGDIRKCSINVNTVDIPSSPSTDSAYFTAEMDGVPSYLQPLVSNRAERRGNSLSRVPTAQEEVSFL